MPDASSHAVRVERAFTEQAVAFEDSARNQVFTSDARWVFDRLALTGDAAVLDVAAGTGHAARQLAARARLVVALDATAAMLAQGQAAARRERLGNIIFVRGDAEALPFLDGAFDAVVSRFAAHHFQAPERVVAEMVRCTSDGGQVGLVDLTADADPVTAAEQNRLERLRDSSHTRALDPEQLAGLLTAAGLEVTSVESRSLRRPLEPWLEQTATAQGDAERIRARLRAELAGDAPTGLGPREVDGELHFTQTFTAAIARRV